METLEHTTAGSAVRLTKQEKKRLNYVKRKASLKLKVSRKKRKFEEAVNKFEETQILSEVVNEDEEILIRSEVANEDEETLIRSEAHIRQSSDQTEEHNDHRAHDSSTLLRDKSASKFKKFDERVEFLKFQLDKGIRIGIDLSYTREHQLMALNSVYKQISLSYSVLKKEMAPVCLHLFSLRGEALSSLLKQGVDRWAVHRHEDDLLDVFKAEEVVYLSPDAKESLTTVDATKVYVIGGIVDRTVMKNMSYDRATGHHISTYRLPIDEYIPNRRTHVLNIDTVLQVLLRYINTSDWKTALESSVPVRQQDMKGKKARRGGDVAKRSAELLPPETASIVAGSAEGVL